MNLVSPWSVNSCMDGHIKICEKCILDSCSMHAAYTFEMRVNLHNYHFWAELCINGDMIQRQLHDWGGEFVLWWKSFCSKVILTLLFIQYNLQVDLNATMGTFNTAALVDGVKVKGEGEMHISFMSRSLSSLNRQLEFVTYTNTLIHPNTADVGETPEHIFI